MGVDKFLQKLLDDCYEKPVQDNVKKQLAALGKGFTSGTTRQRQESLTRMATSADKGEKDFFALMKSETIRGFNTSQQVMETFLQYKVAPGHYYGCVDLKS